MIRKAIQSNPTTLSITLPKKWAVKHSISKGTEISVEETDNCLTVFPGKEQKKVKQISIELSSTDPSRIRTVLAAAYRRGFDEIELSSKSELSFAEMNRIADSLMGAIIVKQNPHHVMIKIAIDDTFEETSSIISKLFTTASYFISQVIEYLSSNAGQEPDLAEMMKSIMKLRDYCQRMIQKTTFEGDKSYEYHILVFLVEKIAGNFKDIISAKDSMKRSDGLIGKLTEKKKTFDSLHAALAKKDLEAAVALNKTLSAERKEICKAKESPIIAVITENLFSISSRVVGLLV